MVEIKVTQEDEQAAIDVRVHESCTSYINHDALSEAFARHREQTERRIVEWLRSGGAFAMTDEEIADQIEQGAHRHDD